MRRLSAIVSVICLLGVIVGCTHTAGVCDCDPHGLVAPHVPVPGPGPVVKPEPIEVSASAAKTSESAADTKSE